MAPNYEAIWEKSYRHACRVGLLRYAAEDIAQDVVEWYLANPEQRDRRKVAHVTIDVLRQTYSLKFKTLWARPWPVEWISRLPGYDMEADLVDEAIKHTNAGVERAAFVLTHKWGMTLEEIAEATGLTAVEVSRALTLATSDVERAIRRDK